MYNHIIFYVSLKKVIQRLVLLKSNRQMSTELIHWFDKFHYFNVEIKSLFSLRNSPFFVKRGSKAEFNSQIQSSRFLLFLEKLAGLVWAENIVLCSAYNLSRVWMVLLLGFCQISLLCRDCGPAPHWHLTSRDCGRNFGNCMFNPISSQEHSINWLLPFNFYFK